MNRRSRRNSRTSTRCIKRRSRRSSQSPQGRQQLLRQLEVLIHGLAHNDLAMAGRSLLRHDLVTTSSSPWIRWGAGFCFCYCFYLCFRKDRCLFLFNDILLITTVSRRGAKDFKRSISS